MRVNLGNGSIGAVGRDRMLHIEIESAVDAAPERCGGFAANLPPEETIEFFLVLRRAIVQAGLADDLREALRAERQRELEMTGYVTGEEG